MSALIEPKLRRTAVKPAVPARRLGGPDAEETFFFHEPESRLRCVIALAPVASAPALGGCSLVEGLDDLGAFQMATRQAHCTTRKLLLADLPYSGAHAVLLRQTDALDRLALFTEFGRAVARTQGRYVAMQGDGTTAGDMLLARRRSAHVVNAFGATRLGGPDAETAFGVFVAMEEALRRLGRRMQGSAVAVVGLGGAGMLLCERLHEAGASLVVADERTRLAQEASARFNARMIEARALPAQRCDVVAPCRPGALAPGIASRITAALVCGTADAPFVDSRDREVLHARGVVYLPDVLVNAGALIAAACSRLDTGRRVAFLDGIAGIGRRVHDIFDSQDERPPWQVVDEWIAERHSARVAGA